MKFATFIKLTALGCQDIGETTQRAAAFKERAEKAGVRILELLWLSGPMDGLIVFEAPDQATASAVMLGLAKSGHVETQTCAAFDMSQMDGVLEKLYSLLLPT